MKVLLLVLLTACGDNVQLSAPDAGIDASIDAPVPADADRCTQCCLSLALFSEHEFELCTEGKVQACESACKMPLTNAP